MLSILGTFNRRQNPLFGGRAHNDRLLAVQLAPLHVRRIVHGRRKRHFGRCLWEIWCGKRGFWHIAVALRLRPLWLSLRIDDVRIWRTIWDARWEDIDFYGKNQFELAPKNAISIFRRNYSNNIAVISLMQYSNIIAVYSIIFTHLIFSTNVLFLSQFLPYFRKKTSQIFPQNQPKIRKWLKNGHFQVSTSKPLSSWGCWSSDWCWTPTFNTSRFELIAY